MANFNINFIIYSQFPEYMDYIGSPVACHTLANNLKLLGENSYVYSNSTHPKFTTTCIPWGTSLSYDKENTIIIFPAGAGEHTFEHLIPDDLKSIPNVVRLMVNKQVKLYPFTDKIYQLFPYFDTLPDIKPDGHLPAVYYDLDLFYNKNLPRNGSCYLIKGGHHDDGTITKKVHTDEDLCIDNYWAYPGDRMEFLASIFNEKETFISYNAQTSISLLAALCGCKSIVIPSPQISRDKWLSQFDYSKYGIAFGLDDIKRAEDTSHLVRPWVEECQVNYMEKTKLFVNDCYTWLQNKYNL
jgi:hypothetical protein